MQTWHDPSEVGAVPSAVAVGVFDGIHRGHQAVISRAVEHSRSHALRSVVVTFDPNPMTVVRSDLSIPVVTSLRHRLELLEALGVDGVLVLRFDHDMAARSAHWFVTEVLVGAIGAERVVVGEDFRFGHRAQGDVSLLRAMAIDLGYEVDALADVGEGGHRWSSTLVRRLVAEGDVAAAAEVLGHPYRVEGTVRRGEGRGRQLGYPTANVRVPDGFLAPADGVYAGWLTVLGTGDAAGRSSGRAPRDRLPAAISVGTNPTFEGIDHRVESYLIAAEAGGAVPDLDLYDRDVAVELAARLRPMERFDSVSDLVRQMDRDVESTREVLFRDPQSPR